MKIDTALVAELLETYFEGFADVMSAEDQTGFWIFPRSVGSPIILKLSDRYDIYAGLTFHLSVYPSEATREHDVLYFVEAIVRGHAEEYFDFEAPTCRAVDDRSEGSSGFAITAASSSMFSDRSSAKKVYVIPAWSEAPALLSR